MREVKSIMADEYEGIIKSGSENVIIMEFFATWCNPCKMLAPVLEELNNKLEKAEVYRVDVDKNSTLADDLDINSVPTLIFYKGGEIKKVLMGFQPLAILEKAVEALEGADEN